MSKKVILNDDQISTFIKLHNEGQSIPFISNVLNISKDVSRRVAKELNLNLAEVRLGSKEIGTLKGFDFVFILTEMEDMIKCSFRSIQGVDVSLFSKELGGGGHKAAAGVYIKGMSLEEAEKKVLSVIEKIGIHKIK